MRYKIQLDFVMLESDPNDAEAMRAEAQDWVDTYANAPGVTARIVRAHGPAGGWPEVELSAATEEELVRAVIAYAAGDTGMQFDLLAEIAPA